jgi:tetratricopeptide (TPR) repeat protein
VPRIARAIAAASISIATLLGADLGRAQDPPAVSWATQQAIERTKSGRAYAARGELGEAIGALMEAVRFDATYAPAYLELGRVYEARGDVGEAERAYAVGIDHVAGFADALAARGKLRARLHRHADAIADFEALTSLEPDVIAAHRALGDAYKAAGALPAALAVARRIAALAEEQGDARAAADARLEARALAALVGEIDPVAAGSSGRGPVRRALWKAMRRR